MKLACYKEQQITATASSLPSQQKTTPQKTIFIGVTRSMHVTYHDLTFYTTKLESYHLKTTCVQFAKILLCSK